MHSSRATPYSPRTKNQGVDCEVVSMNASHRQREIESPIGRWLEPPRHRTSAEPSTAHHFT